MSERISDAPLLTVGILIVSTTASKDHKTDATTDMLIRYFDEEVHPTNCQWKVTKKGIVNDDVREIEHVVKQWTGMDYVELILVSGGTGFAESDVTPEAIEPLLTKKASGLVHAMLSSSLKITPFAMMARPIAGVRNKTVIITLPGSPRGAKENLAAIVNQLPHACLQASGMKTSRSLHSVGIKALEKEAQTATDHTHPTSPRRDHSHSHHHHHHHHGPGGHTGPVRVKRTESDKPAQITTPANISNNLTSPITARARSSPYPMLPVSTAQSLILKHTPLGPVISHPVNTKLIGHILAADITSPESVPAFRASIVDGYAVIASDGSGTYPVVQISHAAPSEGLRVLKAGQIARVTTGAPIPDGATAVVMVEDTTLVKTTEDGKEELTVEILGAASTGQNIREVGSDVEKGSVILKKGTEITASGGEIGVLASVGVREVSVYRKPVVGVLSTGDEVVGAEREGGTLRKGEIRDCNRPALLSVVESWGYEAVDLGVVKDKAQDLATTLKAILPEIDVLITTGGVSMGELDLLKPTLERSLGGTIHFGRVEMKPGKPTTFATVPVPPTKPIGGFFSTPSKETERKAETEKRVLVFALPGNPASALVTFHLFTLPSLRAFSGHASPLLPRIRVTVDADFPLDPRPEYHRVVVGYKKDDPEGRLWAVSTGGQRSSRVGSLVGGNALLVLPKAGGVGDKKRMVPRGDTCEAVVIGRLVGL